MATEAIHATMTNRLVNMLLNATDIARRAGINPSLMRQYTSGVKTAGETTFGKLNACLNKIKSNLQAAVF